MEDYNSALERIKANNGTADDYQTVSIAKPYIENVRRREAAPTLPTGPPSPDYFSTGGRSSSPF